MSDFDTQNYRIKEAKAQLEYIFSKNLTSTCKSKKFYPVKGIRDAFLRSRKQSSMSVSIDVLAILKHTSTGYCLAMIRYEDDTKSKGFTTKVGFPRLWRTQPQVLC